jgi:hypothetical protein
MTFESRGRGPEAHRSCATTTREETLVNTDSRRRDLIERVARLAWRRARAHGDVPVALDATAIAAAAYAAAFAADDMLELALVCVDEDETGQLVEILCDQVALLEEHAA